MNGFEFHSNIEIIDRSSCHPSAPLHPANRLRQNLLQKIGREQEYISFWYPIIPCFADPTTSYSSFD